MLCAIFTKYQVTWNNCSVKPGTEKTLISFQFTVWNLSSISYWWIFISIFHFLLCVYMCLCVVCVHTCACVLFACVCVFIAGNAYKSLEMNLRLFQRVLSAGEITVSQARRNICLVLERVLSKELYFILLLFLTTLFLTLRDSPDYFLKAHIFTLETWFTCMCSLCWWALCFTNMLEGITLGLNSPQALYASCCLRHYECGSPHHRSSNVFILEVCRRAWIVRNWAS